MSTAAKYGAPPEKQNRLPLKYGRSHMVGGSGDFGDDRYHPHLRLYESPHECDNTIRYDFFTM